MLEPLCIDSRKHFNKSLPVKAKPVGFNVLGRNFLYDPNDMRLFHCDEDAQEKTLSFSGKFITEKPQFDFIENTPKMLVFILTHSCNLRCKYCFHNQEDEKVSSKDIISLDDVKNAIKMIPMQTPLKIGFFGGEALLHFDRLKEITEYAKEAASFRNTATSFSVTTNGTLLNSEILSYLSDNEFSLIVSLDGDKDLHDQMRVFANEQGSFDKVMSGLELLSKYKPLARRTTLRSTYTAANTNVKKRVEFLNKIADEYNLGNVSVEPADLNEGCVKGGKDKVTFDNTLQGEYFDTAKWFVEEIRKGNNPRFHHFAVRLKRLLLRMPSISECGAGCGYLTINPAGEIFACHREGNSCIGNLNTGIDQQKKAPWEDNRYYVRKGCNECWLRNICGGGCRLNSIHNNNDIRLPDKLGCDLTETCVKACAWILSELTSEERANLVRKNK